MDRSLLKRFASNALLLLGVSAVLLGPPAGSGAWANGLGWPVTSTRPVVALDHSTVEEKSKLLDGGPGSGYRFVAFGDQRALADGEWQEIIDQIGRLAEKDDRILFMLDTGDIVENGRHSDQFHRLVDILSPVRHLPYLVGVGNHEKNDNERAEALENTAAFLGYLDEKFDPSRMYYRKDIGPVRFLFLDTNDFVYGDEGKRSGPGVRAEEQLRWLVRELEEDPSRLPPTTIAVMHHPIVQSSDKHDAQAAALWNLEVGGRSLHEVLAEGGVDVILTGHTHTYERFTIHPPGGKEIALVNLSGRPRNSFLWFGAGARRARDIKGEEVLRHREKGWKIPEGWRIAQEDFMSDNEADNFAIFTVEKNGGITLEMRFLDKESQGGLRSEPMVRIK